MAVKALDKRFDPVKLEEDIQQWWEENRVYEKSKAKNADRPVYYFLDGPPYCSGSIHIGTAWNKIIKDAVLRNLTMRGKNVRRQPGWDSHGLPIEVKVEKELKLKTKKDIENVIGVENFIKACKDYAKRHMETMTRQFKRLGVWMDWDKPYITFDPKYMEAGWHALKKAHERGLLVQDLRVVHWCPRCETALAEHEVRGEYEEREDPSVYVKFKLRDRENEYVLVWTTTPWTLPANVLIMVKPDFEYARVSVGGEIWILAKELVKPVMEKLGIEHYSIIETMEGTALEGLRYVHPLLKQVPKQREWVEEYHRVVLSEYVDLEEGTGCVHTAPGHGEEDYEIGKRYGAPIFSPLDVSGRFTAEGGKYEGLYVKDADPVIIEDLKKNGFYVYDETIVHSYPHCWRCRTPLIFMAMKQWFLEISKIKDRIIDENSSVTWVPSWVSERYENGVEYAGDWCLSRNRYWGIPMPIWRCSKCGAIRVVGSFSELSELATEPFDPENFDPHRPYVDNIEIRCECGGIMKRVPDIVDVWFDSGIASWSSLGYPSDPDSLSIWPADLVIEGSDQVGKWFYSQQAASVITFDKSCYKKVLMHGFALDSQGKKMSKSFGNVVDPDEVVDKYGADVLRYYMLWANSPWEDLKFNFTELSTAQRMLNVFWNVCVFASTYMELDGFEGGNLKSVKQFLRSEDRWLLSRTNSLVKEVSRSMDEMNFLHATRAIQQFILDDLSRLYVRLARERTWVEAQDPDKLACYETLHYSIDRLLRLLAPIIPHLSEAVYQRLIRRSGRPESIHLTDWPEVEEDLVDEDLEQSMSLVQSLVETALAARQKAGIKLRRPVGRIIVESGDEKVASAVRSLEEIMREQTNSKKIEIVEKAAGAVRLKPNMAALGRRFRSKAPAVAQALSSANTEKVKKDLDRGSHRVEADGEIFEIERGDVEFFEELPEGYVRVQGAVASVVLDTRMNEELIAEGFAKELVRRIQDMRKDMDLQVNDYIQVAIDGPAAGLEMARKQLGYIENETRAKSISLKGKMPEGAYSKKWPLEEGEYEISIIKA